VLYCEFETDYKQNSYFDILAAGEKNQVMRYRRMAFTEQVRSWCSSKGEGESDNAVLFCYRDQGASKTYIR